MSFLRTFQSSLLKNIPYCSVSFRFYSISQSKDLFEVLEEKIEEDIGYEQWLSNTKEALKNSKGRFWLGKLTVNFQVQERQYLALFIAVSL